MDEASLVSACSRFPKAKTIARLNSQTSDISPPKLRAQECSNDQTSAGLSASSLMCAGCVDPWCGQNVRHALFKFQRVNTAAAAKHACSITGIPPFLLFKFNDPLTLVHSTKHSLASFVIRQKHLLLHSPTPFNLEIFPWARTFNQGLLCNCSARPLFHIVGFLRGAR